MAEGALCVVVGSIALIISVVYVWCIVLFRSSVSRRLLSLHYGLFRSKESKSPRRKSRPLWSRALSTAPARPRSSETAQLFLSRAEVSVARRRLFNRSLSSPSSTVNEQPSNRVERRRPANKPEMAVDGNADHVPSPERHAGGGDGRGARVGARVGAVARRLHLLPDGVPGQVEARVRERGCACSVGAPPVVRANRPNIGHSEKSESRR